MAYLKDLLKQVTYICTRGTMDCKVTHICHDSRQVVRGSMFICLAGSREDGHDYLAQAIRKGAAVCVVSKHVWVEGDVTVIRVRNTSEAMAWIARNYYGAPSEAMQIQAAAAPAQPLEVINDLRRYCFGDIRKTLDQITNMMTMAEMLRMMNEPSPEDNCEEERQ